MVNAFSFMKVFKIRETFEEFLKVKVTESSELCPPHNYAKMNRVKKTRNLAIISYEVASSPVITNSCSKYFYTPLSSGHSILIKQYLF